MPKFKVLITSDCTCSTEVDVEADDAEAAKIEALSEATNHPDRFNWSTDDTTLDPYIADPETCVLDEQQ